MKYIWIYICLLSCFYASAEDNFDHVEANFGDFIPPSLPVDPDDVFVDSSSCGGMFLDRVSGQFTSPFYPNDYPNNTICEWVIEVEVGHIIEIKFEDFNVGISGEDINDYVMIFESNEDTKEQYFYGQQTGAVYRSKSNFVVVQFFSDDIDNFRGFKATFDSWNAIEYCDKYSLGFGQTVNTEKTKCRDENKNDFYKRCYVSCNPNYILSKSSKVDCVNGKFIPENVCELVAWEVELCEITNFAYCLYNTGELTEFWLRKESRYLQGVEADPVEINLDIFPDPTGVDIHTGRVPDGGTAVNKPTPCKDNLLKYSYCVRKLNTDYLFNCKAFLKIKKLKEEVAKRKVKACFECRAVDCSVPVYI
uniref:enteropeptidase-like n=1 Tax=Styela clava TaxID=7725 RepID=UPI00193A7D86|nr:enteropeptidase-like [Styela clava]